MTIIGNDIIDLSLLSEHPRSGQPRFWRKVLTKAESRWLSTRKEPKLDVWKLWALKESAYKCYFQLTAHRFFAPKKFSCCWLSADSRSTFARAAITTPQGILYAEVQQSEDYIHAVAGSSRAQLERALFHAFVVKHKGPREQSRQMRTKALNWIAKQQNLTPTDLHWEDSVGYPRLFYLHQPLPLRLSLSHHGQWGACSMLDVRA